MQLIIHNYFKLLKRIHEDIEKNPKIDLKQGYNLFKLAALHPIFQKTEQTTFREYAENIQKKIEELEKT